MYPISFPTFAVVAASLAAAAAFLGPRPASAQNPPAPAVAAAAAPAAAVPAPVRRVGHVFIVSFDGGKPAVMKQSRMPLTMRMAEEGAVTWAASTIFPSITLVSHTSMLTGVGPDKHKILWNEWTPEKGMVPVPTIFSLAKKQKLATAMFVGKQKFAHLFLPGSLDGWSMPDYRAKYVAKAFAAYLTEKKPELCFLHFSDSDGAGHAFGWGSPEQIASFKDEDDALATVRDAIRRAGIEKDSVILLSADHGGHAKTHGSNSPDDMIIPWIAWGKGVKRGFTITAPVTTYDTAATALYLLGVPIPAEFDGKPVVSAFTFGEDGGGSAQRQAGTPAR